ncbi:hypothetical protein [Planctellipticum variicoloris]|uniref:hypothetical protein n=1 Tax=Planctellipticum variicoloris TaxID=3064265 RepID=UPI002D0B4C88|nr:hypothetical protein SH412_003012 [Planctomycetaceae bacterium SH412]HTN02993.1 hypothetical protein [Planctomycetaceae bacterium]
MSTVVVITPLIIANWPAISAAVAAAVGSLGFAVASEAARASQSGIQTTNRATLDIENSEILATAAGISEEMTVQRDGVRIRFSRDERGALKVCVEGDGLSKSQLAQIGQDVVDRVTQQFVYNRLMSEIQDRRMHVIDQEVQADRTVRIRIRNS